jgi:hypothetical protein
MQLIKTMKMRSFIFTAAIMAVSMPWPNTGNCPHSYTTSNGYCTPSQGAPPAIPKSRSGNCPWGWTASGNFCLESGDSR